MRLFEMKELPRAFGKARVNYVEGISSPSRENNTINIPHDGYTELFPLRNDQFLLHRGSENWFGGTDENPFLVQLSERPFEAFIEGGILGPAHFYSILRWKEIDQLASIVRRNWRRQGDIFAVPLNMGWKNLERCFRVASKEFAAEDCPDYPVFGTRHVLKGKVVEQNNVIRVYGIGTNVVASGVIVAPDHSDLNLEDMPHALYQTANLQSPMEAD